MAEHEEHRAIVTNTADPLMLGRIKVKCESLLSGEQELPDWISPQFHFVDVRGGGGGFFGVPVKDTFVPLLVPVESKWDAVQFEQSLQMADVRYKCAIYNDVAKLPKMFKTNYPDRVGYAWANAWTMIVDLKTGEMFIGYIPDAQLKSYIKITKNKEILVQSEDGHKITLKTGEVTVEAAGSSPINLVAAAVKIGGSSAIEKQVHGDILNTFLTAFQVWAAAHGHPAFGAPPASAPPIVPPTLLSTKHTVE